MKNSSIEIENKLNLHEQSYIELYQAKKTLLEFCHHVILSNEPIKKELLIGV